MSTLDKLVGILEKQQDQIEALTARVTELEKKER